MIHQSTYLGKYTCSQGGRLDTSHVLEPYLGSSYLPTLPVYLPPVSQSATLQSAYAGLEKNKRNSNAAQHSTAQSEENRMQWRILSSSLLLEKENLGNKVHVSYLHCIKGDWFIHILPRHWAMGHMQKE